MDVMHTPLPGTMPLWQHRRLPAGFLATGSRGAADGGGVGPAPGFMGIVPELEGTPYGPALVLPSGVRIRRKRIGNLGVSDAAVLQAMKGIQRLPLAHQRLLASTGVPIDLLPVSHLEQVDGTTANVLGATGVTDAKHGKVVPTKIRIAVNAPDAVSGGVNSISEVVQHEIGHVIAVLTAKDRSEEAAIAYAARY